MIQLAAGPLAMTFDPETGFLRRIRLGEREILRALYVAIRNQFWKTIAPRITRLLVERKEGEFALEFDVRCDDREIAFAWRGRVMGRRDGTVEYAMEGQALSTFLRNRIGFCILHPVRECAGRPCVIEHTDGTTVTGAFPERISPYQPFKDIRAIAHEVVPGLRAEVRCEGEVFEMEDQRNWTDASFKTYCTPLELPLPVKVEAGTTFTQRVTLRLHGSPTAESLSGVTASPAVRVTASNRPPISLPALGLGAGSGSDTPSESQIHRLRVMNLAHLRVDLHPSDPDCADHFHRGHELAKMIGVPLEAALYLSDRADAELAAVAGEFRLLKPRVARWLVFHRKERSTSAQWAQQARRLLSVLSPEATFCGGTDGYFVEVNRIRPPLQALDEVSYSMVPQVHASDRWTMVENLVAQSWTVQNAREFCGGLPLVVTPVTFKSRKLQGPGGLLAGTARTELPAGIDTRQMSLFGAGWTLGSLKYLAESGVRSATYFEAVGWLGVMESERGNPLPDLLPSIPGAVFPLYHVLADLGEFAGGEVVPSISSGPERVECMVLHKGSHFRTVLANLGSSTECVQADVPGSPREVRLRLLDERNADEAMRDPESYRAEAWIPRATDRGTLELCLLPYAVATMDSSVW